jgi:predicted HTH domain antitoxin
MSASSHATKQAVITCPAEIPSMLKLSDEEFARELQLLGAAKLFQLGRLSSGKAAQLAGMERVAFLYEPGRIGVPAINLRGEEVEAEIRAARDFGRMTRRVVDPSPVILPARLAGHSQAPRRGIDI